MNKRILGLAVFLILCQKSFAEMTTCESIFQRMLMGQGIAEASKKMAGAVDYYTKQLDRSKMSIDAQRDQVLSFLDLAKDLENKESLDPNQMQRLANFRDQLGLKVDANSDKNAEAESFLIYNLMGNLFEKGVINDSKSVDRILEGIVESHHSGKKQGHIFSTHALLESLIESSGNRFPKRDENTLPAYLKPLYLADLKYQEPGSHDSTSENLSHIYGRLLAYEIARDWDLNQVIRRKTKRSKNLPGDFKSRPIWMQKLLDDGKGGLVALESENKLILPDDEKFGEMDPATQKQTISTFMKQLSPGQVYRLSLHKDPTTHESIVGFTLSGIQKSTKKKAHFYPEASFEIVKVLPTRESVVVKISRDYIKERYMDVYPIEVKDGGEFSTSRQMVNVEIHLRDLPGYDLVKIN